MFVFCEPWGTRFAMDDREATNQAAQEHIERLRRRLADGRAEIARQHGVLTENREHIEGMWAWLEQSHAQEPED